MVEVASQCDVSYLIGEIHQICHELAVVENGRQIGLFDGELLCLNRGNNGLRKRLRILFFDTSLNILAINLLGGRVVLFVLM